MNELIIPKDINKDAIKAEIIDAEGDVITVKFNYDGCVYIDTEFYSHIYLESYTLLILTDLIEKADNYYREKFKKEENERR